MLYVHCEFNLSATQSQFHHSVKEYNTHAYRSNSSITKQLRTGVNFGTRIYRSTRITCRSQLWDLIINVLHACMYESTLGLDYSNNHNETHVLYSPTMQTLLDPHILS